MTEKPVHPFAEDRADFDQLGARVVAMLGEYLRDLPAQPVDRVVPAERSPSPDVPAIAGTGAVAETDPRFPWPRNHALARRDRPPPVLCLGELSAGADRDPGGLGRKHHELRPRWLRPLRHIPDGQRRSLDHGDGRISRRRQPVPVADGRLGGDAQRAQRGAPPRRGARGLGPARRRPAERPAATRPLCQHGKSFLDPEVRRAARHWNG